MWGALFSAAGVFAAGRACCRQLFCQLLAPALKCPLPWIRPHKSPPLSASLLPSAVALCARRDPSHELHAPHPPPPDLLRLHRLDLQASPRWPGPHHCLAPDQSGAEGKGAPPLRLQPHDMARPRVLVRLDTVRALRALSPRPHLRAALREPRRGPHASPQWRPWPGRDRRAHPARGPRWSEGIRLFPRSALACPEPVSRALCYSRVRGGRRGRRVTTSQPSSPAYPR